MDRATVSRIEGWDARAVTGGYAGLSDLAAAEFTGAVAAGGTYLFMLNGRVVGVVDGSLSAFEGADSTAYEAPDPSLPLLFAMRERGGEVRGEYYTDDTPLREVDETLTEGGFTGYLELSENVLSGDYYVVYYGGRSLAAAFVGSRERVVTDEEAFELAADEVGIYEVRSVDLEVRDVPEPPEDATAAAAGTPGWDDERAAETDDERAAETDDEPTADVEPGPEPDSTPGGHAEREEHVDPSSSPESAGTGASARVDEAETDPEVDGWASVGQEQPDADGAIEEEADDPDDVAAAGGFDAEGDEGDDVTASRAGRDPDAAEPTRIEDAESDGSAGASREATADAAEEPTTAARVDEATDARGDEPHDTATSGPASGAPPVSNPDEPPDRDAWAGQSEPGGSERRPQVGDGDERFREEERWREARTVPALDPEESELPTERTDPEPPDGAPPVDEEPADPGGEPDEPDLDALRDRVIELEEALETTERERLRQAERVDELTEERDELVAERSALEERIEELEARLDEREARIEEQEAEIAAGATAPAGDRGDTGVDAVDPGTALDQTDVFVRYGSKGEATLETAHDGRAGKAEVDENLRLETHSRFDADDATVDGRPFREFLADTIEYRFVSWLVEELLYELQGTGNERGLKAVYDALPAIDRAEFEGTVASVDEAGDERQEAFDVVCRDRMGKPLLVANINDSLDPATGEMMGALVEDATAAAEAHEAIGAAFMVTASFFEPAALETAAEATGGGFLSRDSKKSFVKLSRKGGYHLCLVEARAGDFHVAVPEL